MADTHTEDVTAERAGRATVGDTRAFLAAAYGIPHADTTHYAIAAAADGALFIVTCCDDVSEAADLLASAAEQLSGSRPAVEDASASVIVGRDDLRMILDRSGAIDVEVRARLAEAAGLTEGASRD